MRQSAKEREATAGDTGNLAAGFVATATNSESLLREIARAKARGYEVLVTHRGHRDTESVELAAELGVKIVDPQVSDPDDEYLRNTLAESARAIGSEGLVFSYDTEHRIDYERSTALWDPDKFVVDAATNLEHPIPPSPAVMVGIPAYNEESTIADVVRAAAEVADCVVVVDDGSSDETAQRARDAGATVIEHETNSGYGAALQSLFEIAGRYETERLVIADGDGQHDLRDVQLLIETQRERDADVVIGSRFTDNGDTNAPLYRRVGIGIVNVLTNVSMGRLSSKTRISDTQSGFRLYTQPAIRAINGAGSVGNGMSASTDLLHVAHRNGLAIEEVGTDVDYSVEDTSSLNPVTHGIGLVMNIVNTVETRRPITILGIPGFLSTFVGFGFGYWTFLNYLGTDSFPIGLAIASVFFTLAGIFAGFTSIILHSLNTHLSKQE